MFCIIFVDNTLEANRIFFSTLCSVAATFIAIIGALIVAYMIYSKQRRDDLFISIGQQLRTLNALLHYFSELEEHPRPDSLTHNYIYIMMKEHWNESPEGIFKDNLATISSAYEEEMKESSGNIQLSAQLLKVTRALRDLIIKIYTELPIPPGTLRDGTLATFEAFIRDDFPDIQGEFEIWSERFHKFYRESMRAYYNSINVIELVKKIHRREQWRLSEIIEQKRNEISVNGLAFANMEDLLEDKMASSQYYDQFFSILRKIRDQVILLVQDMKCFESYNILARFKWGIVFLLLTAACGVFLPLGMLSDTRIASNVIIPLM